MRGHRSHVYLLTNLFMSTTMWIILLHLHSQTSPFHWQWLREMKILAQMNAQFYLCIHILWNMCCVELYISTCSMLLYFRWIKPYVRPYLASMTMNVQCYLLNFLAIKMKRKIWFTNFQLIIYFHCFFFCRCCCCFIFANLCK